VEAAASREDRDGFILSDFNIGSFIEWYKENNHHDDSNDNEDDSNNKDDESNSNAATSLQEVKNGRSIVMQAYKRVGVIYIMN
jgi:hypothetical protein